MSDEILGLSLSTPPDSSQGDNFSTNGGEADPLDERSSARAERRAERDSHHDDSTPWLGGAFLILLGIIFMARNLGLPTPDNWWAIFILIPAIGAFSAAWRRYQVTGEVMESGAIGSLIGGLVLTAVALVFFFDLSVNFSLVWPVLLIIGGFAILLQSVRR